MLRVKNVSARNFMSVGAVMQTVNFDNGQLTLVLGNNIDLGGDGSRNGTGKTTIINALSYGLYGDALTNIKKNNLINKTNAKQMMVTVEFSKDNNEYRIERGRGPTVLRLFVNGVESKHDDSQGDSRETQKEILKIIGFPHTMFKHIIALNTYTEPFLAMRANDQRDMIEQLLGITDLSAKADILKELVRETKDSIKEEEFQINAIKNSNERIEKNIKDIEKRKMLWDRTKKEKLEEYESAIITLSEIDVEKEIAAHKSNALVEEQTDAIKSLDKEISTAKTSLKRSTTKLEELKTNLESAENGVCYACNQKTSHLEEHETYLKELRQKIADEEVYNTELHDKISASQAKIDSYGEIAELQNTFYDTIESAYEHKHNLENVAAQYEDKMQEENPYTEQIKGLRETGIQEVNFENINELVYLKEHQDFLLKLLTNKDSFIRKRIIDQNLAYLNHRLANYLEKIGLPHEVKFNNDLSVEITEYGRELDFDNLSRGERNRLILSLSFAFRDIYESLNHPMNLMVVDELMDSGMDSVGMEAALHILKRMNRDQGKNIFLISHKEELIGRVNNVLTVVKENGFTTYNTDTEYVE